MTDDFSKATLPTKELAELLDEYGLHETWRRLLATLASKSYSAKKAEELISSAEYEGVELFDKNLLDSLPIGRISVLYEFSLAHVDHSSRKEAGQYFTPDDVSRLLVEQSKSFSKGVWLDPCSGIGNLSYWLTKAQDNSEEFLKNQLVIIDRDPIALFVARSLLFLLFQEKEEGLFEAIKPHFIQRDFLEDTELPQHDYAILNPPYVAVPMDERFETAETRDRYAYFLERIIKSSKGFISITPQSFTHGGKFSSLRKLLMENYENIDIMCFDNMPDSIFKGIKFGSTNTNMKNSTRAAIMIARKDADTGYRLTSLLRWQSADRAQMLKTAHQHLSETQFSESMFPKNYSYLQDFYEEVIAEGWTSLSNFVTEEETAYKLTVPSSPRYFIPAVKRDLARSNMKTIFFKDEQSRNLLYPILNSSLLYWWWKVNDGGMTVSSQTLLSLPIPNDLKTDEEWIQRIAISEANSLVIKQNAGKAVENVKHDASLVNELNEHLFGKEIADAFLRVHSNSDVIRDEK